MKMSKLAGWLVVAAAAMALPVRAALGVKIADVTRIEGQQNNVLMGVGLVYGLKGTGDGGDFAPAIKPLQQMLAAYRDPATLAELSNVSNVALVTVTATLPSNGVHRGDRVDVRVLSMGRASSLRGGQLIMTQMTYKAGGTVYGTAEGTVSLEDPSTPTVGVVQKGLICESTLIPETIKDNKRITLIIDDAAASWGLASMMAKLINDAEGPEGSTIAVATDPRTVEVVIPVSEREHPDGFIARVQRLPLPILPQEARVLINSKSGLIVLTGDVEISPVAISYRGLTIQAVSPKPVPSARTPVVTIQSTVPVETGDGGGAKLRDLVTAFEQLKVPAEDRISIVKELHKAGKLHAKLIVDGVMP